jgi:hypothetical protein
VPLPHTRTTNCALGGEHSDRCRMVRRQCRVVRSPLHRIARVRAESPVAASPASTPICTASPRPTVSANWPTTPHAVASPERGPHDRQLVPGRRLRHALRRQMACHPRRPHEERQPGADQLAEGQSSRQRAGATSTPIRSASSASRAGSGPNPTAPISPTRATSATH